MSQERAVTTPLSTSTFESELNDAVGLTNWAEKMSQNGARGVVSKHCPISSYPTSGRPLRRSKLYLDLMARKSRAILWYKRCSPWTKDRSLRRKMMGTMNCTVATSQIHIGAWSVTVLFPLGEGISPAQGPEDVKKWIQNGL